MKYIALALALVSGCACDYPDAAGWSPDPDAAPPAPALQRPPSAPPGEVAPEATPMPPWLIATARELTDRALAQAERPERVPDGVQVWQTDTEIMSRLYDTSLPVYGLAYGATTIYVARGDLCDRPPDMDGRLVGWVLSHEMLHTAGFNHGVEMSRIQHVAYVLWLQTCGEG